MPTTLIVVVSNYEIPCPEGLVVKVWPNEGPPEHRVEPEELEPALELELLELEQDEEPLNEHRRSSTKNEAEKQQQLRT